MRKHKGFTLVELVVVVMILGILAAVAAPKLLGTSSAASENSLKHSLAVVRDAIERYAAENGGQLPAQGATTQATFKAALVPYLRGAFPVCPVAGKNASIKMTNTAGAITGVAAPTESWHYNSADGQFICNSSGQTQDPNDGTTTYDQL